MKFPRGKLCSGKGCGVEHQAEQPMRAPVARSDTEWIGLVRAPDTSRLSADARAALAAAWVRDPSHEHASVSAFAQVSMTLVGLGARRF